MDLVLTHDSPRSTGPGYLCLSPQINPLLLIQSLTSERVGLRIAFLLGAWESGIEVTDEILRTTASFEDKLNNFFYKSTDAARNYNVAGAHAEEKDEEAKQIAEQARIQVQEATRKAEKEVDIAFRDSFNTPAAMLVISQLVTEFNVIKDVPDDATLSLAKWITRILTILGLDSKGDLKDTSRVAWSGVEIPSEAQPFIYSASRLRDEVRERSRSGALDHADLIQAADKVKPTTPASGKGAEKYEQVFTRFQAEVKELASKQAPAKDILALCDQLRDTHLWNLDIYLEDRDRQPAMVRPVDKTVKEARLEREQAAAAKAAAKAQREAEEAEKKKLQDEKAKLSHLEMFKTEEFLAWDENGIPTKDAKGEEVTKSRQKKLQKDWTRQKKLHEDWLKRQGTA